MHSIVQALTIVAFSSILPLIVLLVFLVLRRRRLTRSHGQSHVMMLRLLAGIMGVLALVCTVFVWLLVGVTHIDCGASCDSTVVSYTVMDLSAGATLIVWEVITWLCFTSLSREA